MEFESANSSIVKSIRQRDLLNAWLRLYARGQSTPRVDEYEPERLDDERLDLVHYTVEAERQPPRLTIRSEGTRMAHAYGHTGKGRALDDYLGPHLAPIVMPVYYACIARSLPVYTIADIDDVDGRLVAYERLLLPFGEDGQVTCIIASLKTICEDGHFEIKNLMRGADKLPAPKLRAVIDRDLFHRIPSRIAAPDVLEFE
ncbi:hypothetical protein [Bradyrhizobium sp. USDA 10063]